MCAAQNNNKSAKIENLFAVSTPTTNKKSSNKSKKHVGLGNDEDNYEIRILSYKTIEVDMLIFACIRAVKSLSLEIELPGCMYGILLIKYVSDELTENLNQSLDSVEDEDYEIDSLKNIFKVGQFIPVKVIDKCINDNAVKIVLSTKPTHINSNKSHRNFQVDSLLWASVVEIAEHCYVLNSGVPGSRTILPFSNVKQKTEYVVGQPIWCVVKKCDISSHASTLTVSTLPNDLHKEMATGQINLAHVLPGTKVDFVVEEVASNGLKGKVFDNCLSCVPQTFFVQPYKKSEKYSFGQTIKTRVLYIEPITKIIYLSLRLIDEAVQPKYEIGSLVNGTITLRTYNGLVMDFPKSEAKGLVTFKRLSRAIKTPTIKLNDVINTKYKFKTTHKCRILDYNRLENIYICTVEADIVKEKHFSVQNFNVGQIVQAKVNQIKEDGIVIRIGIVQGFISNLHISNVSYSSNLKQKFSIGQTVTAKVLQIKPDQLLLTMKQSLLESDNCLIDIQDVDKSKQYTGVVVEKTKTDVAVAFYNGILGYIKKQEFIDSGIENFQDFYYIGQVIPVWINEIRNNKLLLKLQQEEKKTQIQIGQIVNGVVTKCDNDEFVLDIINENVTAKLPLAHLSSNLEYARHLFGKYNIGDKMNNLIWIGMQNDAAIVSLREVEHFHDKKIPCLSELKPDVFLRCSYSHIENNGFIFYSFIIGNDHKIIVPINEIVDDIDDLKKVKFTDHQLVIVKITSVNDKAKEIKGTTKLSEVFNYQYDESFDELIKYFEYAENCKADLLKVKDPVLNYREGDVVTGNITYIGSKGGCVVELEDGIRGMINSAHSNKNIEIGNEVKCVVLHVDYFEGYLECSLKKKYATTLKSLKGAKCINIENTVIGIVLLVKENFIQCVITKENIKELVYLPNHLHINDFVPHTLQFKSKVHEKIKLYAFRNVYNRTIGISKQTMNVLERANVKKKEIQFKINQIKHQKMLELHKERTIANNNTVWDIFDDDSIVEKLSTNSDDVKSEETINVSDEEHEHVTENVSCIEHNKSSAREETPMKEKQNTVNKETEITETVNNIESKKRRNQESPQQLKPQKSAKVVEQITENETPIQPKNNEISKNTNANETHENVNENKEKETHKSKPSKTVEKRPIENDESISPKKVKICNGSNAKQTPEPDTSKTPLLSGVNNFFVEPTFNSVQSESSDDEQDLEITKKEKKKKLNSKERIDAIRMEEEALREKEVRLADSTETPISPDEFERLLLAEPDDSLLWTKYIAFYVESTEVDKARSIARKALSKINASKEQDKFNIWVTLLNLENTYGTKESFDKIFEEAARCNNDLKIYTTTIEILADSQKFIEMDKKIKKCRLKFKDNPEMWMQIVQILFKIERFDEARKLQSDALTSLTNKSTHLQILLKFAKFEFDYGEKQSGETLFETILLSYPSKIDIWKKYIDQLIKVKDIELARKVFNRAVGQKLSVKKMKSLFKAFITFETNYGTSDTLISAKKIAKDYIKNMNSF